jgi:hypothetical protein
MTRLPAPSPPTKLTILETIDVVYKLTKACERPTTNQSRPPYTNKPIQCWAAPPQPWNTLSSAIGLQGAIGLTSRTRF